MTEQIVKGQRYEVESQTPDITDESLPESRKLIGQWLRRHSKSLQVTADYIRQYAHTMGDDNPLFCDEGYGQKTRWGSIIAPPTFLHLVDSTIVAPGLRAIQWIYSGTDWEWFLPVRPGDLLNARVRMYDAIEHRGGHVPRMIEQIGEVLFWNQQGELVCRALGKTMRTPRAKASGGGMQYEPRLKRWADEELASLDALYEKEEKERRGSPPRFWEEVQIGEELPTIHKGPLRRCEIALMGYISTAEGENTANQGAHAYQVLHRRDHPADTYIDPETGIQDHPHRGHWEDFMAREVGMPGVYDVGLQRIPWLAQLMTNWIGDDGFLRRLDAYLRRPNVVGDVTWCKGKVAKKYVQNGEHLVECEVWAENQVGEFTMRGRAIARLPSREAR